LREPVRLADLPREPPAFAGPLAAAGATYKWREATMSRLAITAAFCCGLACFAGCAGKGEPSAAPPPAGEIPVGYGTRPADGITGAVGAVPESDLDAGHFEDMVAFLQGRVPGLQVIRLSSGQASLRIRGTHQSLQGDAEPLLVIDQMPVTQGNVMNALRRVNPREVESVQVLRDVSSTSIYGSRGANGVILVKMRKDR
jgi:TonB-dependent SusC/RagA subfamily outer membrane receptor